MRVISGASAGIWKRQAKLVSGNPCNKMTGGPAPASRWNCLMPLARHVVRRIENAAFATCGSSCGSASTITEVMESFGDPLNKPPLWYEIKRGQQLILNAAAMH